MRVGGWRLHEVEKFPVLIDQRLAVGVKVCRRNSEFIGPSDSGWKRVGEVFVGAYHVDACKVERLSRQVRQRLTGIDLCATLAQDLLKAADSIVVGIECIRLFFRERAGLRHCGGDETEIADGGRDERRGRVDDDRIDGDGGPRREDERERKSCRGRSGMTVYSHGDLPMPKSHRIRPGGLPAIGL